MANRLYRTAAATYTPAVPATIGTPAYCVSERRYTTSHDLSSLIGGSPGGSQGGGASVSWIPDGSNGTSINHNDSGTVGHSGGGYLGGGGGGGWQSPYAPESYLVTTCYPEVPSVPARPARLDYYVSTGWSAGARSVQRLPENGRFTCRLPAKCAATMLGLCGAPFRTDYSLMSHAIVLRPSGYTFVEHGFEVSSETPGGLGSLLEIRRENARVSFYLDGTLVHASLTPSAGETYVGALLYSMLDGVDDPKIQPLIPPVAFRGTLPTLQFLAADTLDVSYVRAELPAPYLEALLVTGRAPANMVARLPTLQAMASDRHLSFVNAQLPTLSMTAKINRSEALVGGFVGQIPLLSVRSMLRTGGRISLNAQLPAVEAIISDRHISLVTGDLPIRVGLRTAAPYLPAGEFDGADGARARDYAELDTALLLVALDGLGIAGQVDVSLVMELAALSGMDLAGTATLGEVLELLALESVAVSGSGRSAQRQALQYATNALTGAMTRYEGYDFLGFTRDGAQSYAWTRDGLYRLGTDTDNGQLLRALIDFGTTDHGGMQAKRLDSAFIGARTDGQCYLRLRGDEGPERVYSFAGHADVKRAKLAKGVVARNWSYRVELVDTSFAEVDAFEVAVGATRRIYERRG